MFEINILKKHLHTPYAEMPQPNPLTWRIMFRSKDTLTSQSNPIKCKDFFNDVVAYKNGKNEFSIYSFKNKVKFNKDGLYVLLSDIANVDAFMYNLAVVAVKLDSDLGVDIGTYPQPNGEVVIVIPNKVFKTTYYVSLLTMMIRCCNYPVKYESWEDIFNENAPMNTVDKAFDTDAKAYTKTKGFYLKPKFRKLWYNSTSGYNSASEYKICASIVHNNGVCNWVRSMKEAG